MAQKVQVVLTDDIDGGEAVETVGFSLDGTSYEIDLSGAHAAEMRDVFARYVGHARRASRGAGGGGTRPRRAASAPARTSGTDNAGVRAWAKQNGFEVSERGRIAGEIREAYDKANS